MSELLPGFLTSSLSADRIRATPEGLRQCLAELAARGRDVWTGPLEGLVDVLIDVARVDLCLARLIEGHSDGVRILEQAGQTPQPGVYGVWASKSVGTGLRGVERDGRWRLEGELRFASGVDIIDRALVPVRLDDEHSRLLDLPADLGDADTETWRTRGMDAARTFTVHVDVESLGAEPVGPANFYLERPGFVVGGLCVAAVWLGGAHHLLDTVATSLRAFPADAHQLRRLGLMEQAVWEASTVVRATVARIDESSGEDLARETASARTCVVTACESVLEESARIVGPGGLSRNARLARVREDLAVYIRQHHLDRTLVGLGEYALESHEVLAG